MKTAPQRNRAKADPLAALRDLDEQIARLHLEVVELTLGAKAEHTIRQWLSRSSLDSDIERDVRTLALAMTLAMELESFTPSHSGATAIDRLSRHRKIASEEEASYRALKGARLTSFLVRSMISEDIFAAEDLATKREFALFFNGLPIEVIGLPLVARLTVLDDATFGTVGMVLPLDAAGLAVAMEFVRPGRGIPHGHRCAAAVYRHVVRHGGLRIEGLNDFSDPDEEESLEHGPSAIDLLAATIVEGGVFKDLTPDVLNDARRLVSANTILEALYKAVLQSNGSHPKMRAVYRQFAEVMIEALHLRALVGSGLDRSPLDRLEGLIQVEVASGFPREAAELFREIRRNLLAAKPREAGEDLTRVIERIRGLRAKTIDQGCTEQEALAAADKVAELLDRYGLSLGEIDLRQQACNGFGIESTRKRSAPLDECLSSIAHFCDCRAWRETAADGTIRSVFFGLPADVEAARYLYERVAMAFTTETAAFQKSSVYGERAGGGRSKATQSFQLGLAQGITNKLMLRKAERTETATKASGRDLVPVKTSVVEEELAKLGLSFTSRGLRRGRMVLPEAFEAGQIAAQRFEAETELQGNSAP